MNKIKNKTNIEVLGPTNTIYANCLNEDNESIELESSLEILDKKQIIIDEALKILKLRGLENLSLRKLGVKIGMSIPVVYRIFGSKHGLILAAVEEEMIQLEHNLNFIAINSSEIEADGIEIFLNFFDNNKYLFDFAFKETVSDEVSNIRTRLLSNVRLLYPNFHPLETDTISYNTFVNIVGQTILAKEKN